MTVVTAELAEVLRHAFRKDSFADVTVRRFRGRHASPESNENHDSWLICWSETIAGERIRLDRQIIMPASVSFRGVNDNVGRCILRPSAGLYTHATANFLFPKVKEGDELHLSVDGYADAPFCPIMAELRRGKNLVYTGCIGVDTRSNIYLD